MGWCDDPKSKKYNQLIKLPTKYNHENLYRKDNMAKDIILTEKQLEKLVNGLKKNVSNVTVSILYYFKSI